MFAYVAMGAVRLARFNSTTSVPDGKYFTGLAIPAAAGVVASLVIFDHYSVRIGTEVKPLLVLIITLTLSFLMVSTIKYRSFKEVPRRSAHYLPCVGNFGAHAHSRLAPSDAVRRLCRICLDGSCRTAHRTCVEDGRETPVAQDRAVGE